MPRSATRPAALGAAALLVFALGGVAFAAAPVGHVSMTSLGDAPLVLDTTATFEDTDGNGVDDDCQDAVLADPIRAAAAEAAVDLDHDGTISVSEAAKSDRTGGANCNHGGYVSGVANAEDDAATTDPETTDPTTPAVCETTVPPAAPAVVDPTVELASNAHGKAVSQVAQSDAVGGPHCNHGGAVSETAKADHGGKPEKADKHANAPRRGHNGHGHGSNH